MSTSQLISHRLFVSALAQDSLPPVFEEVGGDEIGSAPRVDPIPMEVLPGRDNSEAWQHGKISSHQQYDW